MKKMNLLGMMACLLFPDLYAQHQIKFDVPNPLAETPAWGGENASVSAGDAGVNPGQPWGTPPLPERQGKNRGQI